MTYTDTELSALRERVRFYMDEKRYLHTLGVERSAAALGTYIMPDRVSELRAAALLHDVAKCLPAERAARIASSLPLTDDDRAAEPVLHSLYAPIVIREDFPQYATPDILTATERHTLGDVGMTPFDEIIFLSDYIEEGRTYPSCRALRERTFAGLEAMTPVERMRHLDRMALAEAEEVLAHCRQRGGALHPRLLLTADYLRGKNQA